MYKYIHTHTQKVMVIIVLYACITPNVCVMLHVESKVNANVKRNMWVSLMFFVNNEKSQNMH
jgi:hypothetical protein